MRRTRPKRATWRRRSISGKRSHSTYSSVNPPLTRIVSGLPVISCHPNYDWGGYSSRPETDANGHLARRFVAANSPEKTQLVLRARAWSLIPLLLLGGYFGFRLAHEMYGGPAGFVFLVLWCFSPMLLAWGGTICPDATAAALGIVAVYTFREWLHGRTGSERRLPARASGCCR